MKRGEHSLTEVKQSFITTDDHPLAALLGEKFDASKEWLRVEATLHDYIKCEDWFKDGGTCLKKVLRKGKGPNPNAESVVKLRLRITVND